ncbi:MAG: PQQ-dependent sugar dehydrogenase [Planctomycetota bacterium]
MKRLLSVLVLLLAVCVQVSHGQTQLTRVASGLDSPLYGTYAPDDPTDRMFWLQQGSAGTGQIMVQNQTTGTVTNFMNVTGLSTGGERGLLGLAFHPDYQTNGKFYINATGSVGGRTEIREYTVQGNPATSNLGNAASARVLMTINQPFANHNGGWIGFNPRINPNDSQYLYIATGDGGSGGDPGDRSQDITNQLLGKMLRIDPDGDDFPTDPNRNYAIPASNPFVNGTGDDEIWAYGLRNHWRNSFDRETGDLWIGDVGQGFREEINFQSADSAGGENYGWRVMEGNRCNNQNSVGPPCFDDSLVDPVYDYLHNSGQFGGFSVTGGYNYRGSIAQYEGLYFFADYVTENIWTLDPHAVDPASTVIRRNAELPTSAGSVGGIPSFAEDAHGEMYLVSFSGDIFEFTSTSRQAVWNGDDPGAGTPGDGMTWGDAANWTRDGAADVAIVAKDEVVFAPGSSITTVSLGGDRTVGGVRFQDNFTLRDNTLTVLSGNVRVSAGVTARIDSTLVAEDPDASIRKRGEGRLLIGGTANQVALLEGSLGGTGTVANLIAKSGTTVAPGNSTGQLNITNGFRQDAGSTLEIELVDTNDFDVLAVGNEAVLNGDLAVLTDPNLVDSNRGTLADLTILTAADIEGTFDNVIFDGDSLTMTNSGGHAGDGLFVDVVYSSTEVVLETYFALGGDANGDGTVDGTDFIVWNSNKFNSGTNWLSGDFNGDGTTDGADFVIWNNNKFTSVDVSTVPEPALGLSLLLGLGYFLARRRG